MKDSIQNCRIEFRPFPIDLATVYLIWGILVFPTLQDSEDFLSLPKPVSALQSAHTVLIVPGPALGSVVHCTFVSRCCGLYRGSVLAP